MKAKTKVKADKQLTNQHNTEIEKLELSYQTEIDEYIVNWEKEFAELEIKSREALQNMKDRHQSEINSFKVVFEERYPKNIKFSKEFLDLKAQEETLAKQHRYFFLILFIRFKEASFIKKKCENLELIDADRFEKEKLKKLNLQLKAIEKKNVNEINALKQKFDNEFKTMRTQRKFEEDRMYHRYRNKKFDLEIQHNQELSFSENPSLLRASNFVLLFLATYSKFNKTKRFLSLAQLSKSSSANE